MASIRMIRNESDIEVVLAAEFVLIYKHSNRCNVSEDAYEEIKVFLRDHPTTSIYMVDVVADRGLSMTLAERLGVQHKSPQVIFVKSGTAVYDNSHWHIKAKALSEAVTKYHPS